MAKTMDAYLHREFVDYFIQNDGGHMVFYSAESRLH
jgi:hypothetical protein